MAEKRPLRNRTHKQRAKDEVWIYGLADPVTLEIRYIGQTCRSIEYRLYEHIKAGKKGGDWPVTRWVRNLLDKGLLPITIELEHVPAGSSWQEAEAKWIAHYKQLLGKRLLNATLGGEGTKGYRMPREVRERLSQVAKEQGRKPPGSNKGKKFSPEVRARMSAGHKGLPGTPWTPEHKANYLASRTYEPWSEELREKIMSARKDYKATEAHRKSLSIAGKAMWAKRKAAKEASNKPEGGASP